MPVGKPPLCLIDGQRRLEKVLKLFTEMLEFFIARPASLEGPIKLIVRQMRKHQVAAFFQRGRVDVVTKASEPGPEIFGTIKEVRDRENFLAGGPWVVLWR
ncbi:unnamed protein product [Dibothriocephalus latus]|uniref:Uncharacterized protein n=1 Tax=Dibothriocephalus latus TaxID=60516 RepID=A0A3P7PKN0_DIBLA|nr:unnamed protein product [Dibothriocephalus latus]